MNSYFDSFGVDYVASMENAIEAAEVRGGSTYEQLPDGKYQMYIKSLAVKENKQQGGYPSFVVQLTVTSGEFAGRSAYKWYSLEPTKERMDSLKSDLALLGVNLKSVYDLENERLMTGILDKIVDVQIKSKVSRSNGKNYTNYYLNKVVGKMTSANAGNGSFADADIAQTPWGE